ncbi:hypothetical protein V2J09_006249 [Rumex salicifolius]
MKTDTPSAHFKKWCMMQSKIKAGAVDEYKKEVRLMLETAKTYIESRNRVTQGCSKVPCSATDSEKKLRCGFPSNLTSRRGRCSLTCRASLVCRQHRASDNYVYFSPSGQHKPELPSQQHISPPQLVSNVVVLLPNPALATSSHVPLNKGKGLASTSMAHLKGQLKRLLRIIESSWENAFHDRYKPTRSPHDNAYDDRQYRDQDYYYDDDKCTIALSTMIPCRLNTLALCNNNMTMPEGLLPVEIHEKPSDRRQPRTSLDDHVQESYNGMDG